MTPNADALRRPGGNCIVRKLSMKDMLILVRACYARAGFDNSALAPFFRVLNARTNGATLKAIMTITGNNNSPTENPCAGLKFAQPIARKKKT